jgi:uncharacterized protein YciI
MAVFFACFTEPEGSGRAQLIQENFDAHKAWLKQHENVILIAGPLLTESFDYSGTGLIVFRAESQAEAAKIAESDPMHSSGARNFRIVPWRLNEGTITARLTISTGSFDLE